MSVPHVCYLTTCILVVIALSSCKESSHSKTPELGSNLPITHCNSVDIPEIVPVNNVFDESFIDQQKQNAEMAVAEISDYLDEVNCSADGHHPDCTMQTTRFCDGQFDASKGSSNENILIIDSNLEFYANTRYRSRVMGQYEFTATGELIPYNPAIKLPIYLSKTLRRLDGLHFDAPDEQTDSFIPAKWYSDLTAKLSEASDQYGWLSVGHGSLPMSFILEHNPNARVVIVDNSDLSQSSDAFCKQDLERFHTQYKTVADSITSIIKDHKIQYVNASFGYTRSVLKQYWNDLCPTRRIPKDEILDAYMASIAQYYDALFNTEGVLGIQSSDINMNRVNNALDANTDFQNRMRVAMFQSLDSGLNEAGELVDKDNGQYPQLQSSLENSVEFIDIFINFGYSGLGRKPPYNSSPFMIVNPFATDSYPINSSATSWAAPAALSRAIHIKNTEFPSEAMTNTLIQRIKSNMTPDLCPDWPLQVQGESRCKLQDPLFHLQTEAHRLGFASRIEPSNPE